MRYRISGTEEWTAGETVNVSESGVLFCAKDLLDVKAMLEISFHVSRTPLLRSATRRAEVVRRVLSSWPETRPMFGAKFHIE